LEALSEYAALVFLPVARESCCRLIVEAKCMGLNVVTTPNSGAFQSNWYTLPAGQLVKYLRDQSKRNLKAIGDYL
jgi:DNA-directed RNA polymerase subunit E'/Rpb7